jgi:hypothetical protein
LKEKVDDIRHDLAYILRSHGNTSSSSSSFTHPIFDVTTPTNILEPHSLQAFDQLVFALREKVTHPMKELSLDIQSKLQLVSGEVNHLKEDVEKMEGMLREMNKKSNKSKRRYEEEDSEEEEEEEDDDMEGRVLACVQRNRRLKAISTSLIHRLHQVLSSAYGSASSLNRSEEMFCQRLELIEEECEAYKVDLQRLERNYREALFRLEHSTTTTNNNNSILGVEEEEEKSFVSPQKTSTRMAPNTPSSAYLSKQQQQQQGVVDSPSFVMTPVQKRTSSSSSFSSPFSPSSSSFSSSQKTMRRTPRPSTPVATHLYRGSSKRNRERRQLSSPFFSPSNNQDEQVEENKKSLHFTSMHLQSPLYNSAIRQQQQQQQQQQQRRRTGSVTIPQSSNYAIVSTSRTVDTGELPERVVREVKVLLDQTQNLFDDMKEGLEKDRK